MILFLVLHILIFIILMVAAGGGTGSDAASETVSKGTTSKEEVSVPMETTNGIAKTVLLPST